MIACLRTYGWALLSGVLLAWAFPSFHWFPLAWIGLVPLLAATRRSSPRLSAAQFFVAGWIFHTIVLQWLIGNVFWAGGWAILGQQGVCIALSGYWAVMGLVWAQAGKRLPAVLRSVALAVCWMAMEWFQARLFTGFGWASLGYSQGPDVWFSQLASLGGVLLLSGALVGFNALLTETLMASHRRQKLLMIALAFLAAVHGLGILLYGTVPEDEGPPFNVGLFQSNYSQQMKWDPDFQNQMLDMAIVQSEAVASQEAVDLFVWPEALIMRDYRTPRVLEALRKFATKTDVPLFTGTVRRDPVTGDVYNASALIDGEEEPLIYDKVKLAPFGEFIPFESYLSFARDLGAGGGISSGDGPRIFDVGDRRFGPLICFEVLFGPLADERRRLGADFLVVLTNLGWFRETNVLSQELEIARFRAIENRLPLVQCANTGVSGVIDPFGRISIIDGAVTSAGRYITWGDDTPKRESAMVQRRVGALSLPKAATPLWPGSVLWFGRIAAFLGLIALTFLLRPQTAPDTGKS